MRRAACFFVVRAEYQGGHPPCGRGRIGPIAPIKSALQNPAGAGIIAIIGSILRRKSEVLILKNLYISAAEYDYHTLLKVAEMAGLAGIVGFHEAGDGYLVSFPDGENTDTLINDYKSRLKDLENNIWMH